MSQRLQEVKRIERALKQKQPHRAFREITFNRAVIRSGLEHLPFKDALRTEGPIYKILQNELYYRGCRVLPEFLRCLADKEQTLYDAVSIRDRIIDNRPLLYDVVDKMGRAELIIKQQKNVLESFKLLLQVIQLLQPYTFVYEYAFKMFIEKIVSMCQAAEGTAPDAAEMIARIYFVYALYMEQTLERFQAITYFQMCLNVARGHAWAAEQGMPAGSEMLHELVSQKLARQQLNYSKLIIRERPDEAVQMVHSSILIIAEIGRDKYLDFFCEAYLTYAYVLMEIGEYSKAHHILQQVRHNIVSCNDYKFIKLNIEFYTSMGHFLEHSGKTEAAIFNHKKALRLAHLYNHKKKEAAILLNLGKMYAKDIEKISLAKRCYLLAKHIYIDLNDLYNKKKVDFLTAKLMADEITPHYMAMLKASTTRYCAFFNLRQWKNRCRPFWLELGAEIRKQKYENIYCLLDEENPDKIIEPQTIDRSIIDYS